MNKLENEVVSTDLASHSSGPHEFVMAAKSLRVGIATN